MDKQTNPQTKKLENRETNKRRNNKTNQRRHTENKDTNRTTSEATNIKIENQDMQITNNMIEQRHAYAKRTKRQRERSDTQTNNQRDEETNKPIN